MSRLERLMRHHWSRSQAYKRLGKVPMRRGLSAGRDLAQYFRAYHLHWALTYRDAFQYWKGRGIGT